ncbi:MAG: hypothetical protein QNJ98_17300 [Planctomycetota bacterium]|nr:hypothetical protein [Planctomycetota bacterium]
MTTARRTRNIRLLTGLVLLSASACSWAVPADPGLNTELRGGSDWVFAEADPVAPREVDPSVAADAGARTIYLRKCSQCHDPFHPTDLPAEAWPAAVTKYGPRAGLFGAERTRVLNWLMANAH